MSGLKHVLMTADTVGGVWTYALELSRELGRQGVRVSIATMGAPVRPDQRDQARRVSNVALYESEYKLEWMDRPWSDVDEAGRWLLALEKTLAPDVVHLNGYCHAALPFRAPKLVVAHSCIASWWAAVKQAPLPDASGEYIRRVTRGLRSAALVIAPSRAMLDALKRHYDFDTRTDVIANGVDVTRFRPDFKEHRIFCSGRIWDEAKNIATLARVAPALPWPVSVAGDAQGTRIPNLDLLGFLDSQEMNRMYARSGIYVLPARYEPFGLSVLEAALSGCALVLGDIASLRETWRDAAVFVHPDNGRSLESALEALANNAGLRQRFGEKARRRALDYGAARMGRCYLRSYVRLLERDRREEYACA